MIHCIGVLHCRASGFGIMDHLLVFASEDLRAQGYPLMESIVRVSTQCTLLLAKAFHCLHYSVVRRIDDKSFNLGTVLSSTWGRFSPLSSAAITAQKSSGLARGRFCRINIFQYMENKLREPPQDHLRLQLKLGAKLYEHNNPVRNRAGL
jgi:hypothetical protein